MMNRESQLKSCAPFRQVLGTTKQSDFLMTSFFNTVALSGDKFFFLTRKLILRMAGTIVTYELVLMQFNHAQHEVELCEEPNVQIEKSELRR